MSIKDQIRAEIERLKSLHSLIPFRDNYEMGYSDGYQDCCDSILAFLDSLPEQPASDFCKENCKGYQETGRFFLDGPCYLAKQPASEGLEGAAEESWAEYEYRETPQGLYSSCYKDGFIAGAEWQREQMMDEWLKDRDGCFWDGVEEGKKAMEKQMMKEAVDG